LINQVEIVPRMARLGANWLSQIEHRSTSRFWLRVHINYLYILSEELPL